MMKKTDKIIVYEQGEPGTIEQFILDYANEIYEILDVTPLDEASTDKILEEIRSRGDYNLLLTECSNKDFLKEMNMRDFAHYTFIPKTMVGNRICEILESLEKEGEVRMLDILENKIK